MQPLCHSPRSPADGSAYLSCGIPSGSVRSIGVVRPRGQRIGQPGQPPAPAAAAAAAAPTAHAPCAPGPAAMAEWRKWSVQHDAGLNQYEGKRVCDPPGYDPAAAREVRCWGAAVLGCPAGAAPGFAQALGPCTDAAAPNLLG